MAASFSVSPISLTEAAALLPVTDPLPGHWGLMSGLLFVTFVLHLLLMNALLGMALLTLAERLRPILCRTPAPGPAPAPSLPGDCDLLLPKAVAFTVNFGIPPFLFLQCLYGQFIYPSSILMGLWWLSLMALIMLAYYGLYINMTRHGLSASARSTALALSCLLLLGAAFIFVNNLTLLQTPGKWALYAEEAGGVLLNLDEPQLAPRYLHVILACLAVGGLCRSFLAAMVLRREAPDSPPAREARQRRSSGLAVFSRASLAQTAVGLWFFLSLPKAEAGIFTGGSAPATALFVLCLLLLPTALILARKELLLPTAISAGLIVVCMAGMRSLLRAALLRDIYDPPMRAMDIAPFLLFAGSLVFSILALAWMLRLYFRHYGQESELPDPAKTRPSVLTATSPSPMTREERRDALLVNETAHSNGPDAPGGKSPEGAAP